MNNGVTKPSIGIRRSIAWAIRLLGLYVVFGVPWCVWQAYMTTPVPPPPPGISPELFQIITAVVMCAVGALGFRMFLTIYRQDMLTTAREIEMWDFPSRKQDDQDRTETNE